MDIQCMSGRQCHNRDCDRSPCHVDRSSERNGDRVGILVQTEFFTKFHGEIGNGVALFLQIQKKIQDGVVNHLERISVNKSYLMSYHTDEKYEYLDVYLAASMIDYQVKEATGEILFGDKTTRWNMQYKMTFMRSVGSLTKDAKDKEKGLVCPNCGAPLTGTSFGKCEYCGSIVTTGAYDWVLSAFTAIK